MRTVISCLARLLLALGLAAGSIACGAPRPDNAVTILIPWDEGSGENKAFTAVTDQFTRKYGIRVNPQVARDVDQQLKADVAAGDPPDIADFSGPGALYQFKDKLQPLHQIDLKHYAQPWQGLATLGTTNKVYAVPVKADVQSLIWYRRSAVRSPPKTWAALQQISRQPGTPWCLGLASGAVSGWPGASWIADILLSRYGVDKYKAWLKGRLRWNSAEVSNAFRDWGNLLGHGEAVDGGALGALITPFNEAMFSYQWCVFEHGALAATGLTSMANYSYVPFPSISRDASAAPVLVSGDFMGLFTDNPDAKQLLTYLASPRAQALWVSQDYGDAFSADQAVIPASYPDALRHGIASLLQPSKGTMLCFAAGDLMSPDVSTAFSQAVLVYVSKHESLNDLLVRLEKTQQGAGSSPLWRSACSGRS